MEIAVNNAQSSMNETSICPICGGIGELVQIDEEVGCCITLPCWSCQSRPAASIEIDGI